MVKRFKGFVDTSKHTEAEAIEHSKQFARAAGEEGANHAAVSDHLGDQISDTYHRTHGSEFVGKVHEGVMKWFKGTTQ